MAESVLNSKSASDTVLCYVDEEAALISNRVPRMKMLCNDILTW
jgi:hypothetical protein